jgi:hypothetical protein
MRRARVWSEGMGREGGEDLMLCDGKGSVVDEWGSQLLSIFFISRGLR